MSYPEEGDTRGTLVEKMPQDKTRSNLAYFLSDKNSVLDVTFAGDIDTASADVLVRCKDEIATKPVILYFRDIREVAGDAIQVLSQIEKKIRLRQYLFSISSLKPPVLERPLASGIERRAEISDNLGIYNDQP